MDDPFEKQKIVWQARGYYNGLDELSYSHLTRHICDAKTFDDEKAAIKFIKTQFDTPHSWQIMPISKKELFTAALTGT